MLDAAGLQEAAVVASSELDEYVITSLKNQGAQIGVWGVGTKLVTAHDDPALGGVYKLSAIRNDEGQWDYKLKLSEQKAKMSIPGVLQVYRYFDRDGKMMADGIMEVQESADQIERIIDPHDNLNRKKLNDAVRSEALLQPLFRHGQLTIEAPSLDSIRQHVKQQLALLDESHKRFEYPHIYPVGLSPTLNQIRDTLIQRERERLNGID
jgi:nicotinate phosphoribosyltransferase